jgi:hypothetical protein
MAPVILFLFYSTMSLTTPNYKDTGNSGSIYFYPLYANFGLMCLHTLGTWLWVYTNIWISIATLNNKFGDKCYRYLSEGSLWCYATHYLFIVLVAQYVVRPLGLTFIPAAFVTFFGVEIAVLATWIGVCAIIDLFPKKNENSKKEEINGKMDSYRSDLSTN